MKKARNAFIRSVLVLLLCVSMLVGTTFAWFSETITNNNNRIMAGNLDVAMYWTDDLASGTWTDAQDPNAAPVFDYDNWEPGYTVVRYIKIANEGSLALKYQLSLIADGAVGPLADVIDVYYVQDAQANIAGRDELKALTAAGTLKSVLSGGVASTGGIMPAGETETGFYSGEVVVAIAMKMQESAGNEYMNQSIGSTFSIALVATQTASEIDSFGKDYDDKVEFPKLDVLKEVTVPVTPDANNQTTADIVMSDGGDISATVPAGTTLKDGVTELTLTVSTVEGDDSNIKPADDEIALFLDVHVEGVAEGNTTPIAVTMKGMMPIGLNGGNYKLIHVENGVEKEMTMATTGAHNTFTYDPATGDVVLYMASFSVVALISDETPTWNGGYDYSWYDPSKTELAIVNADQLAAFSAIVGGMKKVIAFDDESKTYTYSDEVIKDSFEGKTVKLLANINIGDTDSENGIVFYPVGYYNNTGSYTKVSGKVTVNDQLVSVSSSVSPFMGTFDGNGNTIANFYQNTWEMFGDYNDGYSGTPNHYKDAMGIFGAVYNATIKNLTVRNFQCDGEFAPTGCVVAFAGGESLFENISLVSCNPRVYNTGNGGIVGLNYNSTTPGNYDALTFKNITVDQTNKITALWGSYDVSCGGILGRVRENSNHDGTNTVGQKNTVHFENCHVAAVMDVNNDVCANYQYYQYRYSGMLIGTVDYIGDVPGVSAKDVVTAEECSVTYGDWNEYWYCELVRNSLASYTHDHQFSRLTKISDISEIKDENGAWIKEGNFVIPNADNTAAECYHIFKDENGALYQHTHEMSGYETKDVNGDKQGLNETTGKYLLEDRQRYYLPFGQLFTGYGWGSSPVHEWTGVEVENGGTVTSTQKFKEQIDRPFAYDESKPIKIGDLFKAIVDDTKITDNNVFVGVSPVGEGATVSAVYVPGDEWEDGTLTFSGTGVAKVVITDYFYCTETVIYLCSDKVASRYTVSDDADDVWDNLTFIEMGDIFALVNGAYFNGTVTVKVTAPDGTIRYVDATAETWATAYVRLNKVGEWKFEIRDDDLSEGNYYATSVTINVVEKDQDATGDSFSNTSTGEIDYGQYIPQNS